LSSNSDTASSPDPASPPVPAPPSALAIAKVGTSFLEKQQWAKAAEKLQEAIRIDPGIPGAHANLGIALVVTGDFAAAESSFREGVRLQPTALGYKNLGGALWQQRKYPDAEAAFRQAIALQANFGEAHRHLGTLLEGAGKHDEAEASFRAATGCEPRQPEGHYCLGKLLEKLGRWPEAEASFRTASDLKPTRAIYSTCLGRVLSAQSKWEEARERFDAAMRMDPTDPQAHNYLGVSLALQNRHAEAEGCYRRAMELASAQADAQARQEPRPPGGAPARQEPRPPGAATQVAAMVHNNLGNALRTLDRYDESEKHLREAVHIQPNYPEASNNLGILLAQLGRFADATRCYDEAIRLRPDYPEANMNRSLCQLTEGDFENGWAGYEWRLRLPNRKQPNLPFPRWDGQPLNGRTLLLLAEQGLGDAVQFMRFAAEIPRGESNRQAGMPAPRDRQAGMPAPRVVLDCPLELVDLARTCPGIDLVVPRGQALPVCDAAIPLLSVPGLLGTNLSNIPARVPYLKCDPKRVDTWCAQLKPLPGRRVGIVWQGSLDHKEDRWRSIALARFAALAAVPGVCLCSLQKGRGAEQLIDGSADGLTVFDFGAQTYSSFADTAALMQALDLVVTVDTSVAHVAGALGLPVWVMLPAASDWRWLTDREDSPWYPTMKLFRQSRRGDWDEVFERMAQALGAVKRSQRVETVASCGTNLV